MRRLLVASLLAAVATASVATRAQSLRDDSRTRMREALANFLVSFDRAAARQALIEIAERDPLFAEVHFNIGLLWEADGQRDAARARYERVLTLSPSPATLALATSGLQRTAVGAAETTVADYGAIVQQAARFQAAGLSAFAAARAGDAIKLLPKRWEAYAVTADAFSSLQEYARATRAIGAALQLAPADARTRLRERQERIAADMACAPAVNEAHAAFRQGEFGRAGDLFAAVWREPCGRRDEFGLAAAGAYVEAGEISKARPILADLKRSKRRHTIEEAQRLERRGQTK